MLILSRRVGEKVVIDGEIVLTVLEVGRGGQVRLGIDAPRRHRILRHELIEEVGAENRTAVAVPQAAALASILARLPKPPG